MWMLPHRNRIARRFFTTLRRMPKLSMIYAEVTPNIEISGVFSWVVLPFPPICRGENDSFASNDSNHSNGEQFNDANQRTEHSLEPCLPSYSSSLRSDSQLPCGISERSPRGTQLNVLRGFQNACRLRRRRRRHPFVAIFATPIGTNQGDGKSGEKNEKRIINRSKASWMDRLHLSFQFPHRTPGVGLREP